MNRSKLACMMTVLLLWCVTIAMADWNQDVSFTRNTDPNSDPDVRTVDRGPVVADVVPTWSGKEVLQVTPTQVIVIKADGSTSLTLTIPSLYCKNVDGSNSSKPLKICDQPAVGDVNGDGRNEIVVSVHDSLNRWITELDGPHFQGYVFSAVVWWVWNTGTSAFVEHHYYPATGWQSTDLDAFGVPTICHPQWHSTHNSVAFWGMYANEFSPTAGTVYRLTVLDISNPSSIARSDILDISMGNNADEYPDRSEYTVAAGDLNNDGYDELVCNSWYMLYGMMYDGSDWVADATGMDDWNIASHQVGTSYFLMSGGISLADVPGTGHLRILVPAMQHSGGTWQNARVLQVDPTNASSTTPPEQIYGSTDFPSLTSSEPHPVPAVGGFSTWFSLSQSSGKANPVMFTEQVARIWDYSSAVPSEAQNWENMYHHSDHSSAHEAPAIADVAGWGRPQVIYTRTETDNSSSMQAVDILDATHRHTSAYSTSIVPEQSGSEAVTHRGVPVIDDINGDGYADLITAVTYNDITSGSYTEHHKVIIKALNTLYNPQTIYWSGYQNGPQHKGLYAQTISATTTAVNPVWSGRITVTGAYTVERSVTIQPGTVIEFMPGASLAFPHRFTAVGTEMDSIYFIPAKEGTSWDAISFAAIDTVKLSFCVIRGGSCKYDENDHPVYLTNSHISEADTGVIISNSTDVTVANCLIENCGAGVTTEISNNLRLDNLTISNCEKDGVSLTTSHAVTVANSGITFCGENGVSVDQCYNVHADTCVIENCKYGLSGISSSGVYRGNKIAYCTRAGVYWTYDHATATPAYPTFLKNIIDQNAQDDNEDPIAGCYFFSSSAHLNCNQITHNHPYQIYVDHAPIVMNTDGHETDGNYIADYSNTVWTDTCGVTPPETWLPLMYIFKSSPALAYGHNTFQYDEDGTYMYDATQDCSPGGTNLHDVEYNYFIPDNNRVEYPGQPNNHYAPEGWFIGLHMASSCTACGEPEEENRSTRFQAYAVAASHEDSGQFAQARQQYQSVIRQYSDKEEAIWSVRGYTRSALGGGLSGSAVHDSLLALWNTDSLRLSARIAARQDAVFALLAGHHYLAAHDELAAMRSDSNLHSDSTWIEAGVALVDYLQVQSSGTQSLEQKRTALQDFRNRLHRIMGRATDEPKTAKVTLPISKDLMTAYPNPFNSTINLQFDLPQAGTATLDIFNLMGQKVTTLVNGPLTSGSHRFEWNATSCTSGVYFCRLHADKHVESHKLLLLK